MKNTKFIALSFIFILFLSGCTSSYHELAKKDFIQLKNDGFIIGIEKYDRGIDKEKQLDTKRFIFNDSNVSKGLQKHVTQDKSMMVTFILEFKNQKRTQKDVYNIYEKEVKVSNEHYDSGYKALDKLQAKLKNNLLEGNYTHLIYMAMGWHNDENVSVTRYNKIIKEIKDADKIKDFKPYLVVLTWPSSWWDSIKFFDTIGHFISYPNKSNDADEIGFTTSNYILHNVILSAVSTIKNEDKNITTIAIGHSMGARLISRSIFSREYLKKDDSKGKELDLFIGLQPAFSANRFIKNAGLEFSPYHKHADLNTSFLITSSKYDTANSLAFWSEHLGTSSTYDTVEDSPCNYNIHNVAVCKDQTMGLKLDSFWNTPKRVEFVKASFVDEHNDILDKEMGVFLSEIIQSLKK